MATINPFKCTRPRPDLAERVAALPYDVFNRREATEKVRGDNLTFLRIDRAETQFSDDVDIYDTRVYEKAKELLESDISSGVYVSDTEPYYYVYELIMDGRHQTGIVACASIDDYLNNIIKKHENTREEKELDRIRHVDVCSAQTGPIFLAYRENKVIKDIVYETKMNSPICSFTSDDNITHNVWCISDSEHIQRIHDEFKTINSVYIADGHHRAASAVKVGLKRREQNPGYNGTEEFNYFLSVLFPENELMIMPYNRVVKDLSDYSVKSFLEKISDCFTVTSAEGAVSPSKHGSFGMYLDGSWYLLEAKEPLLNSTDPVESLDVSILQDYLLGSVLGIGDPRTDKRIDFIGGIRGLEELERRCNTDMRIAFSMYPTSVQELFAVSDAGKLMPPKSTWFEPKLRSGLFIHHF